MKSAYEIAMERLEAESGASKVLSDEQKASIAEIGRIYEAKIAETTLAADAELATAAPPEQERLRLELAATVRRLEEKRDKERDAVWDEA